MIKKMPPFAAQEALFRAYDIRGHHQYFTPDFMTSLAVVFADSYLSQSYYDYSYEHNDGLPSETAKNHSEAPIVVIGFDVRLGSKAIAQILVDGLQSSGLTVVNLGLITTPMMAFWAQQYHGHGIMVTASHSDKETLGIKWLVNNASPSSLEIQALFQQLSANKMPCKASKNSVSQNYQPKTNDDINLPAELVTHTYIDAIAQVFTRIGQQRASYSKHQATISSKPVSKLDLTIVIDCMNGATSVIAKALFERFCKHVIMLNDHPNGNFPTGNPDPTEPNRLAELQQTVIINNADAGLAFDGDGDRLMVVDNSGKVIIADHLLYLLAQVAFTERTSVSVAQAPNNDLAPSVLFDIKCSHHLSQLLLELGATPIMTQTGSSLLRQQLQNANAAQHPIFAGELSGHFIFNDSYFIVYDDAMYAALRLLHWMIDTAPTLEIFASFVDSDNNINGAPVSTHLWGEPRAILPPYQLTDITQHLPKLISSADSYLPLTQPATDKCTVVEHLVEYCRYLQRLAEDSVDDKELSETTILIQSMSCHCFDTVALLKTKSEAQQLLPINTQLSFIDGIRLDFTNGFGVLRESNTSHSLTVRFAGNSTDDLKQIQSRFVELSRPFDKKLAAQIAAIDYQ